VIRGIAEDHAGKSTIVRDQVAAAANERVGSTTDRVKDGDQRSFRRGVRENLRGTADRKTRYGTQRNVFGKLNSGDCRYVRQHLSPA
jgi:hypothetical protein